MVAKRSLADILGLLIAFVGVIIAFDSCEKMKTNPDAASFFWLGIFMILGGWLIGRAASTKICPHCAERIKRQATRCKHCGGEVAVTGS
jgi:hypothetical protein